MIPVAAWTMAAEGTTCEDCADAATRYDACHRVVQCHRFQPRTRPIPCVDGGQAGTWDQANCPIKNQEQYIDVKLKF